MENRSLKKTTTFSTKVDLEIATTLCANLKSKGFAITTPPYTVFLAKKKDLACTLYESGKLLIQGKGTPEFVEFYLEPEVLKNFAYTYPKELDTSPHIGIDEAGKGDFFGPLCVAGIYASGEQILQLKEIGVKDSKMMSDKTIIRLGKQIQQTCTHHIVKINPPKYNEIYHKFGNLNHLLAWGHATAIEFLHNKTMCHDVIIDQFAAEKIVLTALKRKKLHLNIEQRHRGEEDLVVAAASILARKAFLEGLDMLSTAFSLKLPKGGASPLILSAGVKFIQKHGSSALSKVCKLHFKTLDLILANSEK